MDKFEQLKEIGITLNAEQKFLFQKYMNLFLDINSRINLISKNDEQYLFEKHIFDSLSLNLFLKSVKNKKLLDIGCGGGFPSVPLAIYFGDLEITAIDSIKKKINSVLEIKEGLNLKNINPICERVENLNMKFDYVTCRAVGNLGKIIEYAVPKLKEDGHFIAYKSKKYEEEINLAMPIIKKNNLKLKEIISYKLPLEEVYERNLLIFKK